MQKQPPTLTAVEVDLERAEAEAMNLERQLTSAIGEVTRLRAMQPGVVARYENLLKARTALRRAYGIDDEPAVTPPASNGPKMLARVAAAVKPDRRASNVSDPEKLRGLRRETFFVMLEAGDEGIANDEFRRRLTERLSEKLFQRVKTAKGGESRAMMDGHLALRRNAPNLGYEMHLLGRDCWALRRVAVDA